MDIFGIGGAFVDFTFKVPEASLKELGLQKAGISFVSPERQRFLIEVNTDLLVETTHGGSVANSVCAAQKIGARCAFASKISTDSYGRDFSAELESRGVIIASNFCAGFLSSVLAFITPDGEKTFSISPGLAGTLTIEDINRDILLSSSWTLVEGQLFAYGASSKQTALDCFSLAKSINQNTALNLGSISVVEKERKTFIQLLEERAISLIIGNSDEISLLFGKQNLNDAILWASRFTEYVVATKGADGAIGRHNGELYEAAQPKISPIINTSGAGDAFLGTLLASISMKQSFSTSIKMANEIAGQVIKQHSTRLK